MLMDCVALVTASGSSTALMIRLVSLNCVIDVSSQVCSQVVATCDECCWTLTVSGC